MRIIKMNKHYKTLELHKIMDMLAEQAGNDETLRMISELEPVTDRQGKNRA